jgi:hypothetical protein
LGWGDVDHWQTGPVEDIGQDSNIRAPERVTSRLRSNTETCLGSFHCHGGADENLEADEARSTGMGNGERRYDVVSLHDDAQM